MLSVDIEKIIPVTEARDMFNKIIDEVEGSDNLYVLTKNGKPAAVVVGVNHLEKLTGETDTEVMAKVDQVGQKEPASDNFNTGDQFNTNDAVSSTAAPAEPTPAEPVTPVAEPAKNTPAKDDVSFGDLPPNSPKISQPAATDEPFMPTPPTPPAQSNPPGSTGGSGMPEAPADATIENSVNPTIPPTAGADNNPTPPTPSL